MVSTSKAYCAPCDHVSQYTSTCPRCHEPMQMMGTRWRPGRRGTRTRVWDKRVERRRAQRGIATWLARGFYRRGPSF